MSALDRSAIARALAKALAFKQCDKQEDAERWAAELVRLLGCAGILASSLYPSDDRWDDPRDTRGPERPLTRDELRAIEVRP